MPIGYLITSGAVALVAWSAILRRAPRRSRPFRLSFVVGLWLNWPLAVFLFLAASTAPAIGQNGVDSPGLWAGLGLAAAALLVLRQWARGTGPAVERALDEGLGSDWRREVEAALVARVRRRPSLTGVLWAPVTSRRRGVRRVANIRYGPARRENLLDLYRGRSGGSGRPVLVHLHPLFGSKRLGTRHLFHRLAGEGWICIGANYRHASGDESLLDVQQVIGWVREHAAEYDADPARIFLAGSSLGGHIASRAACAPGGPAVAGLILLYGYYGSVARDGPPSSRLSYATASAPPCFVAHGERDALVTVEDARGYAAQLRATSSAPVVYAELPGAQHGFDLFRSRRFDTVVDAIEAFADYVTRRGSGVPILDRT